MSILSIYLLATSKNEEMIFLAMKIFGTHTPQKPFLPTKIRINPSKTIDTIM